MKVIKIKKQYTNKNGEEKNTYQFYLDLENGNFIRIEPFMFKDKNTGKITTNTFKELFIISEER